jgi:hypothetical protein
MPTHRHNRRTSRSGTRCGASPGAPHRRIACLPRGLPAWPGVLSRSCPLSASIFAVGSSRMRGSLARALATSTRLRCPPESAGYGRPARSENSTIPCARDTASASAPEKHLPVVDNRPILTTFSTGIGKAGSVEVSSVQYRQIGVRKRHIFKPYRYGSTGKMRFVHRVPIMKENRVICLDNLLPMHNLCRFRMRLSEISATNRLRLLKKPFSAIAFFAEHRLEPENYFICNFADFARFEIPLQPVCLLPASPC